MQSINVEMGREELRQARRQSRSLYWVVAVFSFFANMLMLTGPLYMLQVYDRVLGSHSIATLIALSVLVVFLYAIMGVLDYARGRIMGRIGARFQSTLDQRVFDAVIRQSALKPNDRTSSGLYDLEAVQRLMSSPVLMAVFDIPWTPFFLAAIALFHPWLGLLAVGGGIVLIFVTILNQFFTRLPVTKSNTKIARAAALSEQIKTESEMVQAMGMRGAAFDRWIKERNQSLSHQIHSADLSGTFSAITKTFRLLLQSAMLGLGAYLVLQNELTPGAMIAGSILMGRALAPIEVAIGQWPIVQRATKGWSDLSELLGGVPKETPKTPLPKPRALLEIQQLTIVPPGKSQATLRVISFTVQPGQAVGVIGTSAAGKSTLARAITGVWRPAGGKVRLDGATLDQYDPDVLGQYIGYLPQRVQLFEGTIAENIAKLSENPDAEKIVTAAKKAAAHDMILQLPNGYDTIVPATGGELTGGQLQRIGLARAMYGDPVILVLDEPNSNLDNEGSMALNAAIRTLKSEGKSVLIMAHRPSAIQECDMLLMLENGAKVAFGPKDDVLRQITKNHADIQKNPDPGGVK